MVQKAFGCTSTKKRLRHVAKVVKRIISPSQLSDHQVTHYSIPALSSTGAPVIESGTNIDSSKFIVTGGELLVAKINPHRGHLALVKETSGLTVCSSEFVPLDILSGNRRFFWYVMQSSAVRQQLISIGQSSTRSHMRVRPHDILSLEVPAPSESTQTAIADFLDRKTAAIDELIEKKQKLLALLAEKRAALINQAVTKGLDPKVPMKDSGIPWIRSIPAHWKTARIANVTKKVTNGFVGPTRGLFVDHGIPYLQSLHIKNNRIIFDSHYFVTPEWSSSKKKSILSACDVLVVQTGDIGQVAVVPPEFEGANCHALIILTPNLNDCHGEFLSWVLNSTFGFHSLKSVQTGALHPHLNCTHVREIRVPLPPKREQDDITRKLNHESQSIFEVGRSIRKQTALLAEYRQALITAAVTGQLDIGGAA